MLTPTDARMRLRFLANPSLERPKQQPARLTEGGDHGEGAGGGELSQKSENFFTPLLIGEYMNVLLDFIKHIGCPFTESATFQLGDEKAMTPSANIFQSFVYPQSPYVVTKKRPSSVGI